MKRKEKSMEKTFQYFRPCPASTYIPSSTESGLVVWLGFVLETPTGGGVMAEVSIFKTRKQGSRMNEMKLL